MVRAAIDRVFRERLGLGPAPLFPSRDDLQKPVSRHVVDAWLRKAERLAGLEPQVGGAVASVPKGMGHGQEEVARAGRCGGWRLEEPRCST